MTFLRERVPLFAGVSEEHLTALATVSILSSYNKGQTILFKGATVDGLHVVAVGKAGVFVKVPAKGVIQVAELGSGEVFGETSIIEMGIAGATIKAVDDGTYILMIPQEAFRALMTDSPDFVQRVQSLIASRKAA
ncbi:MAG: cyclic nucleotide-binding domain-containing protein [Elusimicrobia bacterium]|nr:cyclic nucleotide-binding domain-containing protein [Elusimicrobiota bacterium]